MENKNSVSLGERIDRELMPYAERPGQYLGSEYNSLSKDWTKTDVKMAFCFPDTYEIGMSHLGLRVLYHSVNLYPQLLLERVFAPMADMEALMRQKGIPLFSWESRHALTDFDVIGFTLQYEMSFSNILNMLDLAGLPLLSRDRAGGPLVIAGGPCAYNPEPLADFIDLFLLGEGEEALPELLLLWKSVRDKGGDKAAFLKEAVRLQGVYVPSFYEVSYEEDGRIAAITPQNDAPAVVQKRIVKDMDTVPYPTGDLVPFTQVVHDRVMLELMRGCSKGCRFCQAGVIYRPVREKKLETLLTEARSLLKNSGYDELGLLSLSTADYSCVGPLIDALMDEHGKNRVSVSLPSLRVDAFSVGLAEKVQQVRKSGLTFAPEAGTQRMRDIINKGVREEDIMESAVAASLAGWSSIKLYFIIGLPGETMADVAGIAETARRILWNAKKARPEGWKKPFMVSVSVASFIPKPQTPFQWQGQEDRASLKVKQDTLRELFKHIKGAKLSCHEMELSFLEATFSRGDRRLGQVLLKAWQAGCKFDGWREFFQYEKWLQAFADCGLDPKWYAGRQLTYDDILPWQHLSAGVDLAWLWQEWQKAQAGIVTPCCRKDACSGCGVCPNLDCANIFVKENEDAVCI